MSKNLSINTILFEFDENKKAWILVDRTTFPYKYLSVPQNDGRKFYRFFLKEQDAQDFLIEILDVNEKLKQENIFPIQVNLLHTASLILMIKDSLFSVHSPNEVYEFVKERIKV